ncbi:MAG: DMT family transporter [Siculibacillus sp.]
MNRSTANLLLLLTAAIWGGAFVPQQTAMRVMTPMWFLTLRFALTLVVLAPLVWRERRLAREPLDGRALRLMIAVGTAFIAGNVTQQVSLLTTSVANAGFLTSLYILFTPFAALALTHERPGAAIWPAAALGLLGAWLMSGGLTGDFVIGDVLVTIGAAAWALQIVFIGMAMRVSNRPMTLVAIQCAMMVVVCGAWAGVNDPISLAAIVAAAPEIAYTGLVSGFVAYSLQAIAQRHTEASDAAIVFSTEAPFAALFGMVLLAERPSPMQWAGSAVIFAAVLLVQLWPSRRDTASDASSSAG